VRHAHGYPSPEWQWDLVPQAQVRKQICKMERQRRRVPITIYAMFQKSYRFSRVTIVHCLP
jgi:hypothetical protein